MDIFKAVIKLFTRTHQNHRLVSSVIITVGPHCTVQNIMVADVEKAGVGSSYQVYLN